MDETYLSANDLGLDNNLDNQHEDIDNHDTYDDTCYWGEDLDE